MEWIKTEGLVLAVQHEPLHFMRRAGYAGTDAETNWNRLHTEETVRNLAKNGCNLIRMHFFKGSGYKFETEERQLVKPFSQWCKKYGVKLQLYIQFGTIAGDTYADEVPNYLDWVQKDHRGEPIRLPYGHQHNRYHPCLNSPGYWDYLEKIVEDGILNYNADVIGFDNITTGEEPDVCQCENCKKAFVAYLKGKYADPKLATERFGHALLDHLLPPHWNFHCNPSNLENIRNPLLQEWIWFRNESTRHVIERLYNFCKKMNPDVLVEINAHKETGRNTLFKYGLYLPDLGNGLDVFWNECDPQPQYENGILHHKIRGYKLARAMDKFCFSNQPSHGPHRAGSKVARRARMSFAESMAFQYGSINAVAGALPIADGNCFHIEYRQFETANRAVYAAKPRHSVALYESKHSYAMSNFDYQYANILMTQVLLRGKIPYSTILDLDGIKNYKVVILANCTCLSQEEIETLAEYVKTGGSLVITGHTGTCDHWNRQWDKSGTLRARLGLRSLSNSGLNCHNIGSGKVLEIDQLLPHKTYEDFARPNYTPIEVPHSCWVAPDNMPQILDGLRWASPQEVVVSGPEALICEVTEDSDNIYVHLINYDHTRALAGIEVKTCFGETAAQIFPLTNAEQPLVPDNGVVSINMDDVYTILRYTKTHKGVTAHVHNRP